MDRASLFRGVCAHDMLLTIQATIIVSTTGGRRLVKDKCKTLPQRSVDGRVDVACCHADGWLVLGCPHKTHILGFRFWLLDFNFLGL